MAESVGYLLPSAESDVLILLLDNSELVDEVLHKKILLSTGQIAVLP